MDSILYMPRTHYTPEVFFDTDEGVICIKGLCYPENSKAFFQELTDYIIEYLKTNKKLTINIDLQYFNSNTSRWLYECFYFLEQEIKKNHQIIVNWFYDEDNEVAKEEGEELKNDFKVLDVNVIPSVKFE